MRLLFLILLHISAFVVRAELYTALVDLEELLYTESVLIDTLEDYIRTQEERLILLRRYAEAYQNQHDIASRDVQSYISNPINAYLLVKRLTTDWKHVENLIHSNVGVETIGNLSSYREHYKFPSDEDLNGAAVALTRLQDTYALDTSSLARGELNGVKYSTELNAADCFELGRQAYNNEDYYHTLLWMREAENRLGNEANETIKKSDILEYLAFSTFMQGNVPLALDLTNKLLELVPNHPRASGNKIYYESTLQKAERAKKKGDDESEDVVKDTLALNSEEDASSKMTHVSKSLYEKLCRGEVSAPEEIVTKLRSFYYRGNGSNKFLVLAPFKVEEAFDDPKILIFHDVLSDDEIATIKQLAQPRFKRATVQNMQTGELETAPYRISKSAWLLEHEHKHIADVCRRVEDMTGLTMETAEDLQVVNYGIGGHYEPHYDFARKEEKNAFKSLGTGNRIATVLFYMSDVAQGGATVFTNIKAAVWPKKGTAAFWYNLHDSGDGDTLTRHAACPVLAGSKWVSNKWIHERGQENKRPCGMEKPPEWRIA